MKIDKIKNLKNLKLLKKNFKILLLSFIFLIELSIVSILILGIVLSLIFKGMYFTDNKLVIEINQNSKVYLQCIPLKTDCKYIRYSLNDKYKDLYVEIKDFKLDFEKISLKNPKIFLYADSVNIDFSVNKREKTDEKFQYPSFLKDIYKISNNINFKINNFSFNFKDTDNLLNINLRELTLKDKNLSFKSYLDINSKLFVSSYINGKFKDGKLFINSNDTSISFNLNDIKLPKIKLTIDRGYFDFYNYRLNFPIYITPIEDKLVFNNQKIYIKNLDLNILLTGNEKNLNLIFNLSIDKLNLLQGSNEVLKIDKVYGNSKVVYDYNNLSVKNLTLFITKSYVKSANLEINNLKLSLNNYNFKEKVNFAIYTDSLKVKSIPINYENIKTDTFTIKNIHSNNSFNLKDNYLTGNVKFLNGGFSYIYQIDSKFLKINFKRATFYSLLSNFKNLSKKYKKLKEYVDFSLKGSFLINLNKDKYISKVKLYNLNIYGLRYKYGNIYIDTILKDKLSIESLKVNLIGYNKSKILLKGSLKNDLLDISYNIKDFNLKGFKGFKDTDLNLSVNLDGKLKGKIDNFKGETKLEINKLIYKNLIISPFKFKIDFSFSGKGIDIKGYRKNLEIKSNYNRKTEVLNLSFNFKNLDFKELSPFYERNVPKNVYKNVDITNFNGFINLRFNNKTKKLDGQINIDKVKIYLKQINSSLVVSLKGYIKNNFPKILISVKSDKPSDIFKNLTLNLNITDKNLLLSYKFVGNGNFENLKLNGNGYLNLKDTKVSYMLNNRLIKDKLSVDTILVGKGDINKINGYLDTKVNSFIEGTKISVGKINYSLERNSLGSIFDISIPFIKLDYKTFSIYVDRLSGRVLIDNNNWKKLNGAVVSNGLKIKQANSKLLEFAPFSLTIVNGVISLDKPIKVNGFLLGTISKFRYNLLENSLSFKSFGKLNKDIISDLFPFGAVDGNLKMSVGFNGRLEKFKDNFVVSIYSKNLSLKTSFLRKPLKFKDIKIRYYKNLVNIDVYGEVYSFLYGKGYIKVKSSIDINKQLNLIGIRVYRLPVKYRSIFLGDFSTDNLKVYIQKVNDKKNKLGFNIFIDGNIFYSGRLKINNELKNLILSEKGSPNRDIEELKKHIYLNLNLITYNPVSIRGIFGKAVAVSKLKLENSLSNLSVNGYLKLLGGKFNFLKVKYTINRLEINIVDNKPYINAQLSTYLYGTYININIFGNIKSPNITFNSRPPKPKNEIISMLFLKDLPSAVSGLTGNILPLIKDIGRLITKLIPTEEEEEGLFNTGIEISIKPEYSPTEGLVPFIYVKRSISNRIYLAISKALINSETFKDSGWYEIGLKLDGELNFRYKFFENNQEEYGLTISTEFDF